jgi:phosphoglycolate phosphatase
MSLRCVYTDLDGTLLGAGASLFRDGRGEFTLLPARALEACHRAGVEVVLKSGRRKAQVMEDARLIGQPAFIYEVGSGLVIDGDEQFLCGEFAPRDGQTPHQLIAATGAPALLERELGMEPHTPWHVDRFVSHLYRGQTDVDAANQLLAREGHAGLRLIDNGQAAEGGHTYHLIPATASKAAAVERHMRARGYAPGDCIAVGDSREDLGVADVVGRFFLVANAVRRDPSIREAIAGRPNVAVTEERNGEGFYEAVVRSLAEARGA